MPDAPETRSAKDVLANLLPALETVRALRDCTEPTLFFKFINGVRLLEEFGAALLKHPNAHVTIRHRRIGDVDAEGNQVPVGEGYLGTWLHTYEDAPEPECSPESWEAVCAAIEVLCLQYYVINGAPGERELRIGAIGQDADRYFVVAHIPGVSDGSFTVRDFESNDLLSCLLAEFVHNFGLPVEAIPSLRAVLKKTQAVLVHTPPAQPDELVN